MFWQTSGGTLQVIATQTHKTRGNSNNSGVVAAHRMPKMLESYAFWTGSAPHAAETIDIPT